MFVIKGKFFVIVFGAPLVLGWGARMCRLEQKIVFLESKSVTQQQTTQKDYFPPRKRLSGDTPMRKKQMKLLKSRKRMRRRKLLPRVCRRNHPILYSTTIRGGNKMALNDELCSLHHLKKKKKKVQKTLLTIFYCPMLLQLLLQNWLKHLLNALFTRSTQGVNNPLKLTQYTSYN